MPLAGRAEAATARGEAATVRVAALRRGGVVVVLRHAITDRPQSDRGDLSNRAGRRNLSEAGRAQSHALGHAFAHLPLGQVLTGPLFRALDTAELAFGERAVVEPRLTADDDTPDDDTPDDDTPDPALLAANIAWLRHRIRRPSAPEAGLLGALVAETFGAL